MKFISVTPIQLLFLSVLMSVLTAALVIVNSWYILWSQLPVVHIDKTNACVKVENFVNGQAYTCQDVDVLLRQYRKHQEL
jgi:hypothetical protein